MIDHERIMLAYLQLADVAHLKRQTLGRGRFLVLGGASALRAGWPEVAERCRAAILADAPKHLLGRYPSFADAMRDADFKPFLVRTEKFCPFEQAESLLDGLGLTAEDARQSDDESLGDIATRLVGE